MEICYFNEYKDDDAMKKTTHLAIATHQDDVEFMAYAPIAECFGSEEKNFSAIVVSDGAGSPRSGVYEKYSDSEMMKVRKLEQKKAAMIGEYNFLALLEFPSTKIKSGDDEVVQKIFELLQKTKPEIVFTHNLADKHETHIAVALWTISALRMMKKEDRPMRLLGCEVWRGLDWLCDNDKVCLDASPKQNLASALMGVYDSQISGGKAYDLATTGRRLANATYLGDHAVDTMSHISYAVDMTELMDGKNELEFVENLINNMKNEIADVISRLKEDK